jgi:tetratricopeptide (TPR) repeat protein
MLAVAEEGVKTYPRSAALRNNLAVLQERANRSETAEQTLMGALEEDPTLPQLSKNLGDLHYRAGRAEEAQTAYLRAVKLAPRLGEDIYFKLGNIAFKQMRRPEAQGYWREVLALNPSHEMAKRNLETLERMP